MRLMCITEFTPSGIVGGVTVGKLYKVLQVGNISGVPKYLIIKDEGRGQGWVPQSQFALQEDTREFLIDKILNVG